MTEPTDHELLADYARTGSDAAFDQLAARHIHLVHSAARRYAGNETQAEEITQAVFLILARKAGSLVGGWQRRLGAGLPGGGGAAATSLAGWLYQTARLTAANALKIETRRQLRDHAAYMQAQPNEADAAVWREIAPLLDEAMGKLGDTDRTVLVLRFFEGRTNAETAAALGLAEGAVQRRVLRALEKLRANFAKQGVTHTAQAIAGTVTQNAVLVAPLGLAAKVSLIAAKGLATTTAITTLVKGTVKTMTWLKFKFGIIGAVAFMAVATSLVVISNLHGRQVYPSRPASLVEIQQLFNLAAATRPDRCRFEANIEVTTPPYTTEQVKTTLAEIEKAMSDVNAHLNPQQKADWRIAQSNAIVKAQSGKRIQHVREWYSGNYYRLDINDEGMGEERFMRTHPNEYLETWVNIPNSPFSPYASYQIQREPHDMVLYKQEGERFGQFRLWQALKMNREVASLFVASVSMRETNNQKRAMFDYSGMKMDPAKVQELHAQTDSSWKLEANDEELDGKPVTHFTLIWSFTMPPSIHSDFKPDMFQGEMWVGQISGKPICLQELVTNLTQHTSTVVKRQKYNADGFPSVWTTIKINADSSFENQRVTFKEIQTNPTFTDEEAFAPVFPPNYIVSDGSSGRNVILQNPHPEIPVRK